LSDGVVHSINKTVSFYMYNIYVSYAFGGGGGGVQPESCYVMEGWPNTESCPA
jgi:hypothetical protein